MRASDQRHPARRKRSPSRTRRDRADVEPGGATAEPEAPSSEERPIPRFVVPPHARSQLLADLPLRPETRRALKGMGWSTLGDLHNVPWSTLGREGRNLGLEVLADLATIIALARHGRLLIVRGRGSGSFDGLFGVMDAALAQLDPLDRQVLLLRLGAGNAPPLTLRETASRCGLGTRQAGESRIVYALKRLRRIAGPEFEQTRADLDAAGVRRERLEDLLKRQLDAGGGGAHGLAFYVRLLLMLVPGLRGANGVERR